MLKKWFCKCSVICFLTPATFTCSCAVPFKENKQESKIVKLKYDFNHEIISNDSLKNQFKNFRNGTLFSITLENVNFNGKNQNISQRGFANKNTIIWPGKSGKINIKEWIISMYHLVPLGT